VTLEDYSNRFPNIVLERRDGVLLVRLHSDGGPLRFGSGERGVHTQLGDAFAAISRDAENRVVIITGTGDTFCDTFESGAGGGVSGPEFYDRMFKEGRDLISNLLSIEVPVIGVINGPATIHAEIVAMSDVVLAADTAVIADLAHFPNGVVPGDGVHVFWPMVLGINRGRSFLLTGERIGAAEAKALGIVAEVLPAERLMDRAWSLALDWAKKPRLALRYTRTILVEPIKRRMQEELGYGLALEFAAAAARPYGG